MLNGFTRKEFLFVSVLALALGIRQLAMNMVMPFLSTYCQVLDFGTPALAGIALGIFGLTQGFFQIPFGIWSDKIGNKKMIVIGLMQVALGLLLACFAKNIYVFILARALQGSGAITSVGYSWIVSSVESEHRGSALSIASMFTGLALSLAFTVGPLIHKWFVLEDMFLISGGLIIFIALVILIMLKDNKKYKEHKTKIKNKGDSINYIKSILSKSDFRKLLAISFVNNFIGLSIFFIIPQYLKNIMSLDDMWKIFMPSVMIAIFFTKKSIKYANKGNEKELIISSFITILIGVLFYFNKTSFYSILIGTILFMVGNMVLCTLIPAKANKLAKEEYRGTVNGFINSFQYLGSFMGSFISGVIWGSSFRKFIIVFLILICLIGVILTIKDIKVKKENRNFKLQN